MADEATTGGAGGTALNGDGMSDGDQVAIVVDTLSSTEMNLMVAARSAHVIGNEVYIVGDEAADGVDWDMDTMMDDIVLLHWSQIAGATTYLDTIAVDGPAAEPNDGAPDVVVSGCAPLLPQHDRGRDDGGDIAFVRRSSCADDSHPRARRRQREPRPDPVPSWTRGSCSACSTKRARPRI